MIEAIKSNKSDKIWTVSDPNIVQQQANKYYNNLVVYKSDKPKKKYFIIHNNKKIYFGSIDHQDYTHHKNLTRLNNFKKRNASWARSPKYSPAHLAYYLLW